MKNRFSSIFRIACIPFLFVPSLFSPELPRVLRKRLRSPCARAVLQRYDSLFHVVKERPDGGYQFANLLSASYACAFNTSETFSKEIHK